MFGMFILAGCSSFFSTPEEDQKPPLPDPVDVKIIYNSLMSGEIEPCG